MKRARNTAGGAPRGCSLAPAPHRDSLAARHVRRAARIAALSGALWQLISPPPARAHAQLQLETVREFDRYAQDAERQFSRRLEGESPFLWSSEDPGRSAAVSQGEIVVEASAGTGWQVISNGLIHDWTAAVLVPGSDVDSVVEIVSSYDTHSTTFAPSVIRSRVLERDGSKYRVAMRVLKKNVLTVVLDTEHLAEYVALDDLRWWGRSRSTSIREVDAPGSESESLRPPGEDSGFLWRLHAYWRFAQTDRGVIAEHRAISLTRSIPRALQWMLHPVLAALPRESLSDMMRITRERALADAR